MKPLDFIAAVVPSAGVLCVAELSSRKKQHVYAAKVEDLEPAIKQFNDAKQDTYFALASFIEEGNRTTPNALYLRSAFIDIDCGVGKPYLTKQEGATALDDFLQETDMGLLGNPWVVSSGNGLHAYWPFTANIPVAEWRITAENFKRLCQKQNLHIDYTVTADASRVLRVPDTSNWKDRKKPRKVTILSTGSTFEFADFSDVVRERLNGAALPETTFAPIPGVRPTRKEGTVSQVKLLENSVTFFKGILVRTEQGTGCGQLKNYIENAAQEGMEPIWRGLLSWTTKCVDGEGAAILLTDLHPYTHERMREKLKEIKGPYPCIKMDSERPGICRTCTHWGKITNPLGFGRQVITDNTEKEIILNSEVPKDTTVSFDDAETQIKITRPTPPRGFSYGKNGGVYREVEGEDDSKNKVIKHVLVLAYDLFVVDILNVEQDHIVYMMATRPEGPVQVSIPQRAVVSKDETVKSLASQNIIAAFGAGNDKNLFDYVRGCVEAVSVNKRAVTVPTGYGWQADGGFVAGGKIFMPNSTVRQIPMAGLENISHAARPAGTLEAWRKFPQMLTSRGLHEILAIGCGVGFGSPLMEFSGLDGITFHAGSTESGTGKSLALSLAASIWGHPRDYRVGKSTSSVAMQQRAGLLRNLPLISDEITSKSRKDMEWLPEFVFDLSEGRAKERMENGANKERINTSVWALMALLSSNTHIMDYMTGGRKHSSEGEVRRMLEWVTNDILKWSSQEVAIIKSLRQNYATAGDKYAQWITLSQPTARALWDNVHERIGNDFNMSNDERFWHAGASAGIAGCILAGSKYANVVDLPIKSIAGVFKMIIEKARLTVKDSVRSAEDVLNAYTREFYGRFISVRALDGAMVATFGEAGVIDESITRTQVAGRVERNVTPGFVNYFIEENLMKTYCSGMSFGYADFRKQVEKLYRVEYVKKDMLSKTKGPQMRVNAIKISRLESDLVEKGTDEDPTDILSVE